MNAIKTRIIVTTMLFILVIVTGVILSKKGKPYNATITTIHKFLSLATIILTVTIVYHQHKLLGLASMDILFIIISGVLFLIALVSGGVLTFGKPIPSFIKTIHKIASGLAVVFCSIAVYQFYEVLTNY